MARFFSQNQIDVFRECYFLYAHSGVITSESELLYIIRSLGYSPTINEGKRYFGEAQREGRVDFPSFLEVLHRHAQSERLKDDIVAALQAADRKRTGFITVKELKQILCGFGEKMTAKEVDVMLHEAGLSNRGSIKYATLVESLLTPLPDY